MALITRKLEAYEQPKDKNLVTSEAMDHRLTEAEKLATMMESFANARVDQNTSTICPRC